MPLYYLCLAFSEVHVVLYMGCVGVRGMCRGAWDIWLGACGALHGLDSHGVSVVHGINSYMVHGLGRRMVSTLTWACPPFYSDSQVMPVSAVIAG